LLNCKAVAAKAAFLRGMHYTEPGERSGSGKAGSGRLPVDVLLALAPMKDAPAMCWNGQERTLHIKDGKTVFTLNLSAPVSSRTTLNRLAWLLAGKVRNGKSIAEAAASVAKTHEKGNSSSIDCTIGVAGIEEVDRDSWPKWAPDLPKAE